MTEVAGLNTAVEKTEIFICIFGQYIPKCLNSDQFENYSFCLVLGRSSTS